MRSSCDRLPVARRSQYAVIRRRRRRALHDIARCLCTPALLVLLLLAGCSDAARDPVRTKPVAAPPPRSVEEVRLGGTPRAVAVDGDAVWVTDPALGRLIRVDAQTLRRRGAPVEVAAPLAVAAAGGVAWVAGGTGEVVRVDDAGRARPVAEVPDPGGIATGAGAVWVSSRRDGTLVALEARTGRRLGTTRVGASPGEVAVGFGRVWVANTADGTVSRVDPRTRKPDGAPIEVADAQVLALAAGAGAVWAVVSDDAQNSELVLRRLDPRTGEVAPEEVALPAGSGVDVAAGLGSVWTTDPGNALPGTPARPPALVRTRAAAPPALAGAPVELAGAPGGVTVGAGAVWVVGSGDATLRRVRPAPLPAG
jgi:streptogramin lyase